MSQSGASIDWFGLKALGQNFKAHILTAVGGVIDSADYVLGAEVEAFEQEFAEFTGASHCVLVANGLDALYLSLAAAGIGPGDEVIVPAQTFVASLIAPLRLGAKLVLVDVDPLTGLIDVDSAGDAVGPATAAILPVHLHGAMADMDGLKLLASRHGLALIEDAAQAHGASRGTLNAGTGGLAGAFSFYPTKNLGAIGDAGCVITDNTSVANRVRGLRSYARGFPPGPLGVLPGNSRTDEVQAAILRVLLPHLPEWNSRRRDIAAQYRAALAECGLSGLVPGSEDDASHVYHHFSMLVPSREDFVSGLAGRGVHALSHYSPLPRDELAAYWSPANESLVKVHSDTWARFNAAHNVSLPMHPFLSREDVSKVLDTVLRSLDMAAATELSQVMQERTLARGSS